MLRTTHTSCPLCEGELETYGIELWAKINEVTLDENPYVTDFKGTPSSVADDPETGLYPRDEDWGLSCIGCSTKFPHAGNLTPAMVLKIGVLMLPADLLAPITEALEYVANDYAERAGFECSLSREGSDEERSYREAAARFSDALDRINTTLNVSGD